MGNSSLGYKLSNLMILKFSARVSNNKAYRLWYGGDKVTNTRYNELDFKTGLGF
jgi:iron complex outermembrane receptor protein